ncbi:ORC-CDC6 family AAA ATPase [Spirosoma rhododendri]|uniref:Uncharacterized protein n=1 Tax=Spirosoma rhododendri TaxID=2728024 RepID=A0A7L5E1Z1_9BACT|nr:hypothetical protein [Spirosoma rhododendri]QJD81710.1 hypothetical protein HH216_25385 [Spirosoma rhododendri]
MEFLKQNPFVVLSPEGKEVENTSAETIHKLFVDVFDDFKSIPEQGHVFLNGPRGSGKSMMFRFLLPDCQLIDKKKTQYNELPFFGIHIPIKLTSINNPEFDLVKDFGDYIFNEHILTMYFAELIFNSFTTLNYNNLEKSTDDLTAEIVAFYNKSFVRKLKLCGWNNQEDYDFNPKNPKEAFDIISQICFEVFTEATQYLKRNVANKSKGDQSSNVIYNGALCDYLSFLYPILKELKKLTIFPNKPIFLLVDDADNLSESQTVVLNTWVSYRSNAEVSLKISTQLNYKTYNTISGTNIDSPHDYFDINILSVYTSSKAIYNTRIRQIVQKRFEYFFERIDIDPEYFFPQDLNQIEEINKQKKLIAENFEKEGRGYRENDDIQRYAVSNYIKSLKGNSKSGHTFSYSGFNQLVNISSGIIRHFLTPAAKMFNNQYRNLKLKDPAIRYVDITQIPPSVQNEEIRDYSIKQIFDEYDKLNQDINQIKSDPKYLSKVERLRNLINGLGGLFHSYLISDRSERRVFSFAISGYPDPDLIEIINLGIRFGYFHKHTIGNKEGTGRTRLYILSRILAPCFFLDPSSFAGYKFFTSEKLLQATYRPDRFIREMTISSSDLGDLTLFNNQLDEN